MGRLDGKIAIITGAASGIGKATARRVAAEGARTVVADLNGTGAKEVADAITAAGGEAIAVSADMGDNDAVRAMVEAAVTAFGGLDILHNNAAATRLAATEDLPVSAADPAVWDTTMQVNLRGALVAIQAAVPHMIARGGGSVINTASGAGLAGDLGHPAYGASKAALVSLTRYVATEFGKQGVRCNAISPGFIVIPGKPGREAVTATMLRHSLTPRLGTPEDIAALVVFLASDESAFITGQNICVDGGMRAHQPYVADFRPASHSSSKQSDDNNQIDNLSGYWLSWLPPLIVHRTAARHAEQPGQLDAEEATLMIVPAIRRTTVLAGVLATALALAACSSSSSSSTSTSTGSSAASGATSPASSASPAAKGTPVTIGVIGTLSGPQASSSNQGATVAPAWAAWVNASGGINGHPVKVVVLDDKGDPATAQADGQQLVSDGVAAIVVSSDNMVSAFDSAALAKGIPLVGGVSDAQDWYVKPGMFPTMTDIVPGVGAQVGVAVKYGHAKKFANLYCAEVAACGQVNPILAGAAKAAGIGYTQLAVSSTAPSYTAQCLQLQQQNVDYVQLNFATAAAVRFIQNCQAQNYNPTWGSSEQAIGSAFASLPNLTMYGPAYAFPSVADAAPVTAFRTVMQKYAAGTNWREGAASFTWDGLQAVAQAVKNASVAPSAAVTSADVMAGLYDFKHQDLGGTLANGVTYTKGKPFGFAASACYFVVGMKGGQVTAPAGLTPQCPTKS